MKTFDRRGFLRLAGGSALAAMMPGTIRRALAIPAHSATGTIADVEHIVILMQENRSFDHYFGTLRGVRGFGDPRAVLQSDGRSIFRQPGRFGEQLPFRPGAVDGGALFLDRLAHDWNTTHEAFNGGGYDRWVGAKGASTMARLEREDLPFHYALADAFTICDAYHCSLLGPTDPNRFYLWTGCAGNLDAGANPVVDNTEAGYAWSTYPERLERAGISWKIYQDIGSGLDAGNYWGWSADPHVGNYGDNPLLYFHQYQTAQPGEALYEKARRGTSAAAGDDLFAHFRTDVANGTLPQVSWLTAPEACSEHPNWPSNFGAWYVSQIIDALTANPDVWSKTVFLLTYDENDGFFDHMPPPFAPAARTQGLSTVAANDEIFRGDATWQPGPYGLGPRVPMLVISPWSRGGYVNSQMFDHTSIIRFIERRFATGNPDLIETNISAWRRAVCGDLTTALDFAQRDVAAPLLPDTSALAPRGARRQPSAASRIPSTGTMPAQEHGLRPARALPYRIDAHGRCDNGIFSLTLHNSGDVAAVFHVRSRTQDAGPWVYTVGPARVIVESWPLTTNERPYEFSVHGPNGFLRRFKGHASDSELEPQIEVELDARESRVSLIVENMGNESIELVVSNSYNGLAQMHNVAAADRTESIWDTSVTLRWYDLRVANRRNPHFRRQLAGYIENGSDGFSDPAIGTRNTPYDSL